jgi:putative alpha-1,2-mannosidase
MFRVIINRAKKYFTLTALLWAFQTVSAQKKATDYVNVFTGTSNSRWMLFPGPTQPFGMVK